MFGFELAAAAAAILSEASSAAKEDNGMVIDVESRWVEDVPLLENKCDK